VLTHNKTCGAIVWRIQQFFPDNAVGYFVSYYDYYQPEAYMPVSNTYIEKDLSINEELDNFVCRHCAIIDRKTRYYCRRFCKLHLWYRNPTDYENGIIVFIRANYFETGLLHSLVNSLYNRSQVILHAHFPCQGDTIDINFLMLIMVTASVFW